jgi:hypothetical protein
MSNESTIQELVATDTLIERLEMLEQDCKAGREKELCQLPVIQSFEAFPFVPMLKHEHEEWSAEYHPARQEVCEALHDVFYRWGCKFKNYLQEGCAALNPDGFLQVIRLKEDDVRGGGETEELGHVPMFRWFTWIYLPLFLRH